MYNQKRALELLRAGTNNPRATFRDDQEEAIRRVVEGHSRLLVVQKTGWGKSFVYFIATKLLREAGYGPALLISPLLALMRNQIAAAERMGLRAATINSDNKDNWDAVKTQLLSNQVDILLISPERLSDGSFRQDVLAPISASIQLMVIDEAHCISDWGHDFRPDYRLIEGIIKNLPRNLRVLATTATANNRVMEDLKNVLGPNIIVQKGDLDRSSLTLQTIKMPEKATRMACLAQTIKALPGSGIIYTLTIRDAHTLAKWLSSQGIKAEAYSGQSGDERPQLEDALINNELKVLVATTALGMGFDKPDLAFVIHYQMPGSVVAYYQQVGRAGRALDSAYGVLLCGNEDNEITDFFINSAFPAQHEVSEILNALGQSNLGLTETELLSAVNLKQNRLRQALKLLSFERPAPVAKQDRRWQLTTAPVNTSFWERAERLKQLRYYEREQMEEYAKLPFGQHMAFLIRALDGDTQSLQPPKLPPLSENVSPVIKEAAINFIKNSNLAIEPRKKWPNGGMPKYNIRGNIAPEYQAQEGRALGAWGDGGWGSLVKKGRYQENYFSDELVQACVDMYHAWNPSPAPTWVTCIPSARHPDLVPDFASRLAQALGLPFSPVLVTHNELRPEQKGMANTIQQARNVDGSLNISNEHTVYNGPVLLIDDIVNSRWTFTIASWILRSMGSGPVWPLALASSGTQNES